MFLHLWELQEIHISYYYFDENEMRLNDFTLIDVMSISPRDRLFKPLSFKMQTGLIRKGDPFGKDHLIYQFDPGVGLAFQNEMIGLYYGMLIADLEIGGMFDDHYAMGVGAEIGATIRITDLWKVIPSAKAMRYEIGDRFTEGQGKITQTFTVDQNNTLGITASRELRWGQKKTKLGLTWHYYF